MNLWYEIEETSPEEELKELARLSPRERWRQTLRQEYRCREDREADEAAKPRWGEL